MMVEQTVNRLQQTDDNTSTNGQSIGTPKNDTPQASNNLSISLVLSTAWAKFKEQAGLFIGLTLVMVFLIVVIAFTLGFGTVFMTRGASTTFRMSFNISFFSVSFLLVLIPLAAGIIFQAAMTKAALTAVAGGRLTIGEAIKQGLHHFWGFLVLMIVVGLIVIVGFIALIIPGVVALFLLSLSPYAYLDKEDTSVVQAIKTSVKVVKNNAGLLMLLFVIYFVVTLVSGFIPLLNLVTAFVLGPMSMLALAQVFSQSRTLA